LKRSIADVFGRARTPARPGPGELSEASLRALDITIGRRIEGLLAGDFRAPSAGDGAELLQVRAYSPGDDVRRIDWNVTARTGEPHVRIELAERVLTTWIVLDLSASMGFGTAERRKADVAEGVMLATGHLASRRGNRLGVVVFGDGLRVQPPRQGRRGLLVAIEEISREPSGAGSLGEALELVSALAAQRSLVVVISDFRGSRDWQRGLLRLVGRHRTLAIEVRDRREQQLADIGELRITDPETGRQMLVDTRDPAVRARFALLADEERRELTRLLGSVGVPHVALTTEGDWLRPLAAFLRRSERR
jgi:uncharacterized protein (DUF58 family)